MDIAASTTATGRKLLIYAKKIIEVCMAIEYVIQNMESSFEESSIWRYR